MGQHSANAQERLHTRVEESGIRRVDVVAWRDLDDPEAGGSELHAHEVLTRWAAAGVDVRLWTSRVDGAARAVERGGYLAHREGGRYAVFPRTIARGLSRHDRRRRRGRRDLERHALLLSGVGAPAPGHLPAPRARRDVADGALRTPGSARLGPSSSGLPRPLYRRDAIVTLSASSKAEIVERLGFAEGRVTVASPGIDPRFTEGVAKDPDPLVVAVGRLVPVKRFDWFIDAMAKLRADHPGLRAVVVGEGYERPALEARVRAAGAEQWLTLPGRVSDAALVELYRRAWLLVSTSAREGWGMTLTEAGACGTPTVATRIAGHEDALVDGVSGVLVDSMEDVATAA